MFKVGQSLNVPVGQMVTCLRLASLEATRNRWNSPSPSQDKRQGYLLSGSPRASKTHDRHLVHLAGNPVTDEVAFRIVSLGTYKILGGQERFLRSAITGEDCQLCADVEGLCKSVSVQ